MKKLILKKFQKYNKNTLIKFLNYKVKVIGPLGILEKNFINKNNKSIYYLFILNNINFGNNNIFVSKNLVKVFFNIIEKLIIGVTYG